MVLQKYGGNKCSQTRAFCLNVIIINGAAQYA